MASGNHNLYGEKAKEELDDVFGFDEEDEEWGIHFEVSHESNDSELDYEYAHSDESHGGLIH